MASPTSTLDDVAASSFPWLRNRPPFPAFRRSTVTLPFAGSFLETLCAVAVVLARHNEAAKAVLSCPLVGAGDPEVVPVSIDLGDDPGYGELLEIAARCTAASSEDDLPGGGRIFVAAIGEPNLGEAEVDRSHIDGLLHERASSDIDLVVDPAAGVLRCGYDAQLAGEAAMRRLLEQIRRAARLGAADPDCPVGDLDLLGEDERAELIGGAPSPPAPTVCVHEAIRAQAEKHPDRVAATFGEEGLTYRRLDGLANGLAARLRELGVARGDRVGVRIDRSLEQLVAIYGVLEAGAAYVPIDPHLPPARQRRIAELAGLEVLVGSGGPAVGEGVRELDVGPLDRAFPAAAPRCEVEPGDTAYLLFTSGSTGSPKGVAISHAQVMQLFATTRDLFGFSPSDVWLNAHTFAFDASVWEIFGALLHGGRVVVASREDTRDPEAMVRLVEREAVTMLTTTPTAFDGFRDVALDRDARFPALRFVVLCAEALNPAALQGWFDRWGEEKPALVNMYGITETTVHSTFHRLRREDAREPHRRIGRGLPDTPLYLLDPERRMVPFGVAGEIYVGGPRVAAGYFSAGEEEEARFMPDPFSATAGARVYRSGDRGRWLPDGTLEYLGRLDHQVKVRGYRIELGEIEHALLDHPSLRSARAWAVRRPGGPPVLAACAVPAAGASPDPAQLREFLLGRLPDYMVPANVLVVDELPLTANGKLDLAGLPDPLARPAQPGPDRAAPGSPLEDQVAQAMAQVLGLDAVERDASFFELGGDSITAVRLVGRLRKEGFAAELPQVYELRTARALAGVLRHEAVASAAEAEPFGLLDEDEVRWLPEGAVDAYPATRMQRGLLYQNAVDPRAYHDVLSYTVEGPLEEEPFREALELVVAAHPILRTSFVVEGPRVPLQVVHPAAEVACTFVREREAGSETVDARLRRWAEIERRWPFDWRVPGLLRLRVHVGCDGDSTLSVSVHHAILDGWSVALLVTELLLAYARIRAGESVDLRSDARHLRRLVSLERAAERTEADREFWREYVEDADPAEVAPLGGERNSETAGGELQVSLPADAVRGARELAKDAGVPLKTVYLTAHAALMSYVSGKADVLTGLVTGTRVEDEGGDEALGLFLNTLPFRLAPGEASWRELLSRAFEGELAVYRHRRYPFERIRADAGVARLCPTGFNYTDFHIYRELGAAGIGLKKVHYDEKTDFQLLVTVAEDPAGDGTTLTLSYDATVDGRDAELYARLFAQLVRGAASAPEEPALGALAAWADEAGLTWAPVAPEAALETRSPLSRVAENVDARPDSIAQVHGDAAQSFAELGVRVSAIREALLGLGAGPGTRVACFLDRGLDPLSALLGTWAAGTVYVPVDPSLPPARQEAMVGLAGCSLAIASAGLDLDPLAWTGPKVVLDDSLPTPASGTEAWAAPAPAEEAYVLFTSGSTGEPKAVGMPHRSVANLVSWQVGQPELTEPRRVSQFAALSFDVSVQEMLATASSGGTLFVVPDEAKPNPQALLEFLVRHRVEVCFLPVVALQQLAGAWEMLRLTPATLRWVVTAGEELIVTDAIRDLCRAASIELVNQYGPTETHVVTHYRLGADTGSWPERPPIGTPLPGVELRVLDSARRPLPAGTPGELYVGGACVADGYVNGDGVNPPTAERFVRLGEGGGVFYRTGDLVRAAEGGLRFVGRADDQLKLRGHRVEPSEVSAVLMRDPRVRSCAVRAHEVATGRKVLVAYVVRGEEPLSGDELISAARAVLPEYAVPAQVQFLDRLPKTKSGKLDFRSLPAPRRPRPSAGPLRVSATERRLLEIWQESLGQPVASTTVSFFDAGGDSLMTLQLYGRLRGAFGEGFAMHDLFRFPTVRSFAAFLDEGRRASPVSTDRSHSATVEEIAARAARNRLARAGKDAD